VKGERGRWAGPFTLHLSLFTSLPFTGIVLYHCDNRSPWRFDAACGHVKQSAKGRGPPCVALGLSYYPMPNNGRYAGPRILVVDDDPRCRAMVVATLTDEGFAVLEASNGYQATGLLSRPNHDIRLLIVDTEMPGLHGWEVIRFATSRAPRLRVLRLGRCDDAPPGPEYQAFRSVPCLPKPFTPDRLLASIRRRRTRRALPFAWQRGALR